MKINLTELINEVEYFNLLSDRILIKLIKRDKEVKEGEIVLPEVINPLNPYLKAIVVKTGPGFYHKKSDTIIPLEVNVGDIILLHKLSFRDAQRVGKDFILIRENEIHMVVESD